jgi:DNA-binding CsgD family transcriptional regulator
MPESAGDNPQRAGDNPPVAPACRDFQRLERPAPNGPSQHLSGLASGNALDEGPTAQPATAGADPQIDAVVGALSKSDPRAGLVGRRRELEALEQLLKRVRAGQSQALVLCGEAGIGKSALLEQLARGATGCRLARAACVASEMELPYAGLHQLCISLRDFLERVPEEQRGALATVFGRATGDAPERFLVGLATLSLFAEVAEERPLICIVDNAQWLDYTSAQILGFVARRLLAERVAVVCAMRGDPSDGALAGLPELSILGLGENDARSLLLNSLHGALDRAVCDRIITESHGNPLALLEWPRTWNALDLAGGFGLPASSGVPLSKIEQSFARRLIELPSDTQLFVLTAAAEPLGDPLLLHRAAECLNLDRAAARPALDAGLLKFGGRVEFAHPLLRSAAYRSAGPVDRQRVHNALANGTDGETDPDRRAWHLAAAAAGPDEKAAVALELSARRAQARAGLPAAAAFLQRAVALTGDLTRRARRALAAAEAALLAGGFDVALGLLAIAELGPLDELQSAHVDLLRGASALLSTYGSEAPSLLLNAAQRLEPLDIELARDTYLDAWGAALLAGNSGTQGSLLEVSRAARSARRPEAAPRPSDRLLDSLAMAVTDGPSAAAPFLKEAARTFAESEFAVEGRLRYGWLTVVPSCVLWDEETAHAIHTRHLQAVRHSGALALLALDLETSVLLALRRGELALAAEATAEADALTGAIGAPLGVRNTMMLTVLRGHEQEARVLIEAARKEASSLGQGGVIQLADWMFTVLCNSLGRYEEAVASPQEQSNQHSGEPIVSVWKAIEVLEAATRSQRPDLAHAALARVVAGTAFAGTDSALGILARSRALVSEGDMAERLYQEAIDRLGRSRLRPELARAHLLYGEWLHRENRRVDARVQLRAAHEQLSSIGMEAFAERARRELLATGVRKHSPETRGELTAQERQIARLARDGLSNPEIGTRLFLSARTVEWHLRKVYSKLGVNSRRQLRIAFPDDNGLFATG